MSHLCVCALRDVCALHVTSVCALPYMSHHVGMCVHCEGFILVLYGAHTGGVQR